MNVALTESVRPGRQDLECSCHLVAIQNRKHQYGTNFQAAIGCRIDSRVDFSIVATLHLPALNAGPRESSACAQTNSQTWSVRASGRAANHLIAPEQSNSRSGCGSGQTCLLHNFIQHQIKREIGGMSAVTVRG